MNTYATEQAKAHRAQARIHREQARRLRLTLRAEKARPLGQRDAMRIFRLGTWIAERVALAQSEDLAACGHTEPKS